MDPELDEIRNAHSLEAKVLQDWHVDGGDGMTLPANLASKE